MPNKVRMTGPRPIRGTASGGLGYRRDGPPHPRRVPGVFADRPQGRAAGSVGRKNEKSRPASSFDGTGRVGAGCLKGDGTAAELLGSGDCCAVHHSTREHPPLTERPRRRGCPSGAYRCANGAGLHGAIRRAQGRAVEIPQIEPGTLWKCASTIGKALLGVAELPLSNEQPPQEQHSTRERL